MTNIALFSALILPYICALKVYLHPVNFLQGMFESDSSLATESVKIINDDGTARPPVGKNNYVTLSCMPSQYGHHWDYCTNVSSSLERCPDFRAC